MNAAHDERAEAARGERRIGAFFDVDHTLIDLNSGASWLRHAWRTGQVRPLRALRAIGWLMQYRMALLDLEAVSALVARDYAGVKVSDLDVEVREWFYREIEKHVCVEGRLRVADHLARGHVVSLLTSGTRFSTTPLAELLSVPHVLCTDIEVVDGVMTGRHLAPACAGPGKVFHAERFAREHSIDLSQSYFYTDSFSDLPMLERVGSPRVVNPDPRLRRRARTRGWEIETWRAP